MCIFEIASCLQKYWPYFQGWAGLPNAKHHQLCQKIKGFCWIGRKVWLCYVFWKKDKRNPKPDYFAIIFILMTSGQVSRARCLEAAHHNQHHVPSSGSHREVISSQISNMDHLIILFFFTDGNWIPRHERVHSAIPRGFLQFPWMHHVFCSNQNYQSCQKYI